MKDRVEITDKSVTIHIEDGDLIQQVPTEQGGPYIKVTRMKTDEELKLEEAQKEYKIVYETNEATPVAELEGE